MALLKILTFPDSRLRTLATPIKAVDDTVSTWVDDMLETMYDAPGIGLAATQVNIHKQLIVIDISEAKNDPLVMINPQVTVLPNATSSSYDEGCLSVPGFYESVERPSTIKLKALDRFGKPFELECDGLLATCIQHEIDHLNGKLFVDYLSTLKRNNIRQKLLKEHKS